jgi:tRNA nucleotidyltransferase (CCA-adding enzyme)
VGGCVRDMLLGAPPEDWDVCTSATPDCVKRRLAGFRLIETGVRHGVVTVISGGARVDVSTFRTDGAYSDNRRPDSVTFVRNLREDLARRDFTVNAMACSASGEVIDYFRGRADLKNQIIRCVGDGAARFAEDALRILRALRFASALGFNIESATLRDAIERRRLLKNVSAERASSELGKLLTGRGAADALSAGAPIIMTLIPELSETVGFAQNNPYHDKDVWNHTLAAIDNSPPTLVVRLALLLHDIAKPRRYTNVNGVGRFHGHPALGAEMAKAILRRLKFGAGITDTVVELIRLHDDRLTADAGKLTRMLLRIGPERLRLLLAVQRADALGHSPHMRRERLKELSAASAALDGMMAGAPCLTPRDLAVNGHDLIDLGMEQGPAIGAALSALLELVALGELPNDRDALLKSVRNAKSGKYAQ